MLYNVVLTFKSMDETSQWKQLSSTFISFVQQAVEQIGSNFRLSVWLNDTEQFNSFTWNCPGSVLDADKTRLLWAELTAVL